MQTIREFTRKTKRGNILKIVREHYLRIDLGCGSDLCNGCQQEEADVYLRSDRMVRSNLFNFPHYLVLDTNVVLQQIDALEEDAIKNVIILSTVLSEVKHRSSAVYKRFHEIAQTKARGFFVFVNEHHKDTYVERQPGETANDRNDRAIRFATNWYDSHILEAQEKKLFKKNSSKGEKTRVVLISDDAANREKAKQEGILVASAEDYINSLVDYPMLIDKLARKNFENEKESLPLFPIHLSSSEILEGIKNKRLLQGAFQASRENFLEGSVNVEGYENPADLNEVKDSVQQTLNAGVQYGYVQRENKKYFSSLVDLKEVMDELALNKDDDKRVNSKNIPKELVDRSGRRKRSRSGRRAGRRSVSRRRIRKRSHS